ncbi:MAG: asparagine synthase (glutamine-hydrolyzing), partial [Bacteroidota bacterium]
LTNALKPRGPDGEGHWRNAEGTVAFGHRRLAVIDLSDAAAQPFIYSSRYTLVFNGEIYNYQELKASLKEKGYSFKTSSDTEVLAAAYDCWKSECLQKLDGMFTFAIWDEVNQELFLARDRFGEKPLYYSFKDGIFLFASECKALWAAGVPRSWNHLMLLGYLANGHTQNALDASITFYKNIEQIPPAHYGVFKLKEQHFSVNMYWDLDKQMTVKMKEEEATEQFLHLFKQSITRRLRSDVAVGTSLSGGLDSSSIAAMIHEVVKDHSLSFSKHSFTAIFPGYEKNEKSFAEGVSTQFGLHQHTVEPTMEGLLNDWDKLCYHQEQPFGSASVYAQFKVMELAAKEGVTVLIDGQGADETLAESP